MNPTPCRFPEKQRPRPSEVLLPAYKDADIHPFYWGVHLCQRQGHRPGLLWWLRGEGNHQPLVFSFSFQDTFCLTSLHWDVSGEVELPLIHSLPLLFFLFLQLFPFDKITDKSAKVMFDQIFLNGFLLYKAWLSVKPEKHATFPSSVNVYNKVHGLSLLFTSSFSTNYYQTSTFYLLIGNT